MELGLSGKVALVTGASRGIGRGIALSFAAEGCDLLLTGRDRAALDAVTAAIRAKGRKAALVALDLRTEAAAETLVAAARREFGHLDILINNAGTTQRGSFFELSDAQWQDGYALKFFAHVRLAAAVAAFTKCLADIGKTDGVQVNCVHPSLVETERQWKRIRAEVAQTGESEDKVRERFVRKMGFRRYGTVEDVADLVTFIVSARATWLHGATIDLDGGEIGVL